MRTASSTSFADLKNQSRSAPPVKESTTLDSICTVRSLSLMVPRRTPVSRSFRESRDCRRDFVSSEVSRMRFDGSRGQ